MQEGSEPFPAFLQKAGPAPANTPRPVQAPGERLPGAVARRLHFETDAGTWMSLDVSPDGTVRKPDSLFMEASKA